jgi:GTP-binding protein
LKITAEFVRSAAAPADFPIDGLPEVALVGRSNVGKSSAINALVGRRVARASAAPGKTRLANLYRVAREARHPLYLVDLPGYGYTGRPPGDFEELTRSYFAQERREGHPSARARVSALLFVDVRHPGLQSDIDAWAWLSSVVARRAIVGTKVDKLARGQRIRAMRELESVFDDSVLPVSAVTGEGLDELWKLIDTLVNSRKPQPRSSLNTRPKAMAPPPRAPSKVEGPKK